MTALETTLLLLAIGLFVVSGFLAMAETSLSRIDAYRAQALAEEGRRGSNALVRLVESPERFSGYLNSLLLLLLASQIVWSTAIADFLLNFVSGPLFFAAVVVEVLVGYVVAVATPKTLAVQHTERAALLTAPVIVGLGRVVPMRLLTRPLIGLVNILVPGKGLRQGPFIFEQQILALADTAAAESVIERDEHRLIHSVIEFGTTIAREVMIPRTDMVTVGHDWTASEAMDIAIAKGYSCMPVHGEESDDITGMLFTKDLMRAVRDGRPTAKVSDLRRDAKFIPETKRVVELLREMQQEKVHMAIVVDEYGSVVGLVTLEDLVEEVVGEITDEYDVERQPDIEVLGNADWRVDARSPIDNINEELGLLLPHGDWDTVGGLLINAFERVPGHGESMDIDNYRFWVEQTSGARVTRVRIKVLAPAESSASEVDKASSAPFHK